MSAKSLAVWVVLIGCFAVAEHRRAGAEESDKAKVKKLYQAATSHYNLGEFKEALDAYKEAYRASPDPVFLYNLAQCYRQLNQPMEAAREYRAYLRERPDAKNRVSVEKLIADMDAAMREQRATQPPLGTEPPQSSSVGAAATPTPEPAPVVAAEPAPVQPRPGRDYLAISLLVAGGVVIATGIGLVAYSSSLDGQAHDPTVHTDLGAREDLLARSGTVAGVGYAMLGVGAALVVASVVKFIARSRARDSAWNLEARPGRLLAHLGGSF